MVVKWAEPVVENAFFRPFSKLKAAVESVAHHQ